MALSRAPVRMVKAISVRSRSSMSLLAGIVSGTCRICSRVGAGCSCTAFVMRQSLADRLRQA